MSETVGKIGFSNLKTPLNHREEQLEIINKLLLDSLKVCLTVLQKFVTKDVWQEVEEVIKTAEKETGEV